MINHNGFPNIMARAYQSPTTFCEVTYDTDWFEEDRHFTPYRYSLLRSDSTDSNSDTVSLTLPSYTYYEYLRSLYDCRTTATPRYPPGYHAPSACSVGDHSGRATTWHAFNKEAGSEFSRQAIRSEPTRIRPTYPFPSLHLLQQGDLGNDLEDELAVRDRTKSKLVWVDALNRWVPESQVLASESEFEITLSGSTFRIREVVTDKIRAKLKKQGTVPLDIITTLSYDHLHIAGLQYSIHKSRLVRSMSLDNKACQSLRRLHPRPYISFVGNAPKIEKPVKLPKELCGGGGEDCTQHRLCDRFEAHMGRQTDRSSTPDRVSNRQRNNEKREAARKKAQEIEELKKQRKAYSTPLYTSLAERKLKVRAKSGKVAHSTPVSPISQKQQQQAAQIKRDKIPLPRQAWQQGDGQREKPKVEPKPQTPTRKEISITLTTPKPEEPDPIEDDSINKVDKKVAFTEKKDMKVNKKKKKEEDEMDANKNTNASTEDSDIKLIDALIKKRNDTKVDNVKQSEDSGVEEVLNKPGWLNDDLTDKHNDQHYGKDGVQVYESTMNAAGLLLSHEKPVPEKCVAKLPPIPLVSDKKAKNVSNTHKAETKKTIAKLPESKQTPRPVTKHKQRDKKPKNETIKIAKTQKPVIENKITEKIKVKEEPKVLEKKVVKETVAKTEHVKIIDKVEAKVEKAADQEISEKKSHAKRRKVKTDAAKKTPKVKTEKPEKQKKKKDTDKNETKEPKPPKEPKAPKEPKEKPSRPMLAGIKPPPKPPSGLSSGLNKPKKERLPITKPSEVELEPEPLPTTPEPKPELEPIIKPDSPHRERRKSILEQRHLIIKKERKERKGSKKEEEEEKTEKLPEIDTDVKKIDSWIYETEDFSEKQDKSRDLSRVPSIEPLPSLSTDLNPEFVEKKVEVKEQQRKKVLAKLIGEDGAVKKWRKPGQKDSSYQDEMRRLELAEERRKKQMEMYERLKNRRASAFGDTNENGTPRFDDYGFLSKYCIFTQGNMDMYKHAFDAVDEDGSGWLEGQDVMVALRGANNRLTEAEEEYLYRVLELTGYKITHGADFKMFSVLAALSHKISALEKWMKNMIGGMDFKQLEMKMFKCKELWECNVDKDSNTITLDQLCVELRAGGVSFDHELEVREKLSHLNSLDLLDFLTYVPLFIMIHESVVENPLNDSRTK